MVVIILAVFFALVVVCSYYEVWRNNKQYQRRKEMETDASIFWSKEQALKMQEPTNVAAIDNDMESKPMLNGKLPQENGKNGYVIETPVEVENNESNFYKNGVQKDKRLCFRENSIEERDANDSKELVSVQEEEEEEENTSDEDSSNEKTCLTIFEEEECDRSF